MISIGPMRRAHGGRRLSGPRCPPARRGRRCCQRNDDPDFGERRGRGLALPVQRRAGDGHRGGGSIRPAARPRRAAGRRRSMPTMPFRRRGNWRRGAWTASNWGATLYARVGSPRTTTGRAARGSCTPCRAWTRHGPPTSPPCRAVAAPVCVRTAIRAACAATSSVSTTPTHSTVRTTSNRSPRRTCTNSSWQR